MTDDKIAKAIIIAGAMIAFGVATIGFGSASLLWAMIGIGVGGYIAHREIWQESGSSEEPSEDDVLTDRFR